MISTVLRSGESIDLAESAFDPADPAAPPVAGVAVWARFGAGPWRPCSRSITGLALARIRLEVVAGLEEAWEMLEIGGSS
jgi:hypothetical protein